MNLSPFLDLRFFEKLVASILNMEKTIIAKVTTELKFISRCKTFLETGLSTF